MSNNSVYGTDWRKMETCYFMVAISGGIDDISELDKSPPKVEYSLTEKGKSLFSIPDGLCKWSENNLSR